MIDLQFETEMQFGPKHLLDAIQEAARIQPGKHVLEDITFKPLTYRRLILATDLFSQVFKKNLDASSRRTGVLLPNVNALPITLMALWNVGKTPAVLNYSTGTAVMLACAELAALTQIITSKTFIERAKIDAAAFR